MFWSRKSTEPESPPAPDDVGPSRPAPSSGGQFDAALDTIAIILRAFGNHAFDTAEVDAMDVRHTCDRLATELVLGRRGPDDQGLVRDWSEARRFVADHRQHEQRWVTDSLGNMRQALQTFATCLTKTISEDRADDEKMGSQLGRLVGAFQANDAGDIRVEAEALAVLVQHSIERRREREKEQLAELGERVRSLRQELREAREQANLDGLTQVFNRAAFDNELARLTALGIMLGTEPCLLMVDVDHFKQVNDTYGHQTGDEVLKKVADQLVKNFLRKEDFVARYGGEEFAIVLPDSDVDGVWKRAERVRLALRQTRFEHAGDPFWVSVSIGVAALQPGEEPEQWLRRADAALYRAKEEGRDRTIFDGYAPDAARVTRPRKSRRRSKAATG